MPSRELPRGPALLSAGHAVAYEAGRFRLLGTPDRSWDWPHVELADAPLSFRSVEELLQAPRR